MDQTPQKQMSPVKIENSPHKSSKVILNLAATGMLKSETEEEDLSSEMSVAEEVKSVAVAEQDLCTLEKQQTGEISTIPNQTSICQVSNRSSLVVNSSSFVTNIQSDKADTNFFKTRQPSPVR